MDSNPSMSKPLVNIIGGGIGGLSLARCLKSKGIPATIYERASSPKSNNYGITLYSSSYRALLAALNVSEQTFKSKVAVDAAAPEVVKSEPEIVIANRGKLEEWLREGVDVRWGHKLEKLETQSSGRKSATQLLFQNRQTVQSSITIAADGPHSAVRTCLYPEHDLTILPYVALNGKTRYSMSAFKSLYPLSSGAKITHHVNDLRLNVGINSLSDDDAYISWIYSRPARSTTDALYKPQRAKESATQVPEEFYEEVAMLKVADLPALYADIFDAERLRDERILNWLMRCTIMPREDLEKAAEKGVVFVGDAVHAEPILGGEGANVVIEDALSLAEWIANGKSLGEWYEMRYEIWEKSVKRSEEQIKQIHSSAQTHASL